MDRAQASPHVSYLLIGSRNLAAAVFVPAEVPVRQRVVAGGTRWCTALFGIPARLRGIEFAAEEVGRVLREALSNGLFAHPHAWLSSVHDTPLRRACST